MKLDGLVRVTPGFKAAVNLMTDLEDRAKISAYIPTRFAANLLLEICGGLEAKATARSFLVHGAYGTGKSHLALTLAALMGVGWERGWLDPVMEKLDAVDAGLEGEVRRLRTSLSAPLLVVPVYGSEGPTRQVLLAGLDEALRRAGLERLMPETAFHAAATRIAQYRNEYPESVPDMASAFERGGYPTIEAMESELRKYNRDALRAYEAAHPSFSRGARADSHQGQRPEDVYRAVARALQRLEQPQRRAGILVLWDEFGLHLESVLDDSGRKAYIDLQQFVEVCSASGEDRLFFLGLAHRSVEQTVQLIVGLPASQREMLNRVAGRFLQRPVTIEPGQQYNLLARVLLSADAAKLEAFWLRHSNWVKATAVQVKAAGLFDALSTENVEDRILKGVFPLHPVVTFLLPAISEKVAQNDRTLFHFMADTGPDGLPAFLAATEAEANGRPNLLTVDRLFSFFASVIGASRHEEAKSVWGRYRKLPPQASDEIQRILQALLLLLIANRPDLPASAQGLALALGLIGSEAVQVLEARLGQMQRDKLVRKWPNGTYDFRGLDGEVDLFEALDTAMADVPHEFDMMPVLKPYADQVQVGCAISPRGHNQKFAINRAFTGYLITPAGLKASIYSEHGAPREQDGIAYWVLPADDHALQDARITVMRITNPRVLVILPQSTPALASALRKRLALDIVQKRNPKAFGEGAPQDDEWSAEVKQVEKDIRERLDAAYRETVVGLGGKLHRCRTVETIEELASIGMNSTFPKTMTICHEKLVDETGADSYKQHRSAAIKALLELPLDHVANITSKPVAFVVEAELIQNGWLRQENGDWVLGRPDEGRYPNSAAVWDAIEDFFKAQTKRYNSFLSLITDLTNPPFGLRRRTIPVLLAAVVRCHLSALSFYEEEAPTAALLERAVQKPQDVYMIYAALSNEQRWILLQFLGQFSASTELKQKAPLRQIEGLIQQFIDRLPGFAKSTQRLSETTRALRNQILIPIATGTLSDTDDRRLRQILFEELPTVCGLVAPKGANLSAIQSTIGRTLDAAVAELKTCFEQQVLPMLGEVLAVAPATINGIQQAALEFATRAEGIPRVRLLPVHRAFIESTRRIALDPLGQVGELGKALGYDNCDRWQDNDLIAMKVAGTLYRRDLLQMRDEVEAEAELAKTLPPEDVQPAGGQNTVGQPRQIDDPVPGRTVDVSHVSRLTTTATGGPGTTGNRGAVDRAEASKAAIHDVRMQVGARTHTAKAGGVISGQVQRIVNGVTTVLNQPGLSREEKLRVLAEVLVQLLGVESV
ncbi:MAG TPA: hypothetical protein VGK74_17325 [Symbiobacteriaceae bacterium]|jgi:hypothetical protein